MTAQFDPNMRQKGSVLIYVLIAIFLTGMLIASMTQGVKKTASSEQLNEMMLYLQADIKTIQSNITECVQTYPQAVIGVTNPNAPFPLYHDLSDGGTGDPIATIKCPGAPTSQQTIFSGAISQSFKLLQDTSNYTTTYFTNGTSDSSGSEGVYIRITRAISDPLWSEAISRLNTKYSACAVAAVTANPDPLGFDCSKGCLYYWILRLPTSSGAFKTGCP